MKSIKEFFVLISIFLLLILSFPLAQAKSLHGAWHYSGDTFTVEDDVFLVTHYNFEDMTVVLYVNDDSYVINEGDCKLTPTRQYCIDEIFRDLAGADEDDPIKFEEGVVYAGIYIKIDTRGPEISVSRDFSATKPELNEEVSVDVTVKNEGTENAGSFIYEESFPEEVIVTSSSFGTQRTYRSVIYETKSIAIDDEKTFSYRFKVTDYIKFTSSPEASYMYEGTQNSVKISDKKVEVTKPYDFKVTLSPKSVETTDQTALSIKIENEVSDNIEVEELKITIPPFVSLQTRLGELEKKNENYYWSGSIEPEKYKMLNLLLKPLKSGVYEIPATLNVTDSDGKEFSDSEKVTLTSKIIDLEPILSVRDSSVSEGADFRVAFSVKNPNKRVGFKNINASVVSEIFPDMKVELEELLPDKTQTLIVDDALTAPFLDEKKNYNIEALGSYDTTTNERFEFSEKETLTVTPVSQAISIIQSTDKKEADAGGNITVTVKIKNNNEEAIQVNVYDKYPGDVNLIGGKTSGTVFFEDAGTEQAYTYKLQIPLTYDKEELEIISSATIEEKDFSDDKTLTIKVKPPEPEEEEEPEEEPEIKPELEQEKEKKPGFLEKVVNAVAGFFKRLLGID
ncbi:hypothetical protein KY348_06295 [Candidatus Woesearchaeota archaeon]|nr:hypothetical protein [Candidatus Woesearchaeota archaeon]